MTSAKIRAAVKVCMDMESGTYGARSLGQNHGPELLRRRHDG
jgi:hypothetical protein